MSAEKQAKIQERLRGMYGGGVSIGQPPDTKIY